MTRFLFLFPLLFISGLTARAQDSVQTRQLDSIRITARYRLRDMGMQKTSLDSMELHSDITGSLAHVLTRSSSLFIKHYGRATLSTASFRGTSPSHQRHLPIPYTGHMERDEDQFTHAGYGGFLDHSILFH